jgi:2'-5' RNA ligase
MSTGGRWHLLVAIDIAILPPPEVSERAIALSAALPFSAPLPAAESQGLRLGPERLPHVTLTQQFVSHDSLDAVIAQVDQVLRGREPLRLRVTGGGKGSSSVWMAIERTASLVSLHEQLLQATEPFEVQDGGAPAFVGEPARDRDVRWVREFRRASSFARFTPHITLGHASTPPHVEPMDFVATRIAVCHLGRFCTCHRIIRAWELSPAPRA